MRTSKKGSGISQAHRSVAAQSGAAVKKEIATLKVYEGAARDL
jgi:hypothetical protein